MHTLTHQLVTEGHPPYFTFSEADATSVAEQRLPRPSSLLVLWRHSRTGQESWEFVRVVA